MNPSRIVITGTIAAGKSTLSSLLRKMGYLVIDSDKINKRLLEVGNLNYMAIKNSNLFNEAFIDDNLDKKKLAEIIFSDKDKMLALNELTHKNIIKAIEDEVENSCKEIVFIEIPLYFSMKEKFVCDFVWLVDAKRDVQIQRLMDRDKISREYAIKKIEAQENKETMIENSDFIFDNSGEISELKKQVLENLKKMEK